MLKISVRNSYERFQFTQKFVENLSGVVDAKYNQFANFFIQYGLEQLVTEPTRLNSILDLVFCTSFMSCSDIKVLTPFSSSDHCNIIANSL